MFWRESGIAFKSLILVFSFTFLASVDVPKAASAKNSAGCEIAYKAWQSRPQHKAFAISKVKVVSGN
jgi:hypothetical protein